MTRATRGVAAVAIGALALWTGCDAVFGTTPGDAPPLPPPPWAQVDAGTRATCGITEVGSLYCWGEGVIGGLSPRLVPSVTAWRAVSVGNGHSCGIQVDDTLWCWGDNVHGQLGLGTTDDANGPVQIMAGSWESVSAGDDFSCGIQRDGSLWCWGSNTEGQIGNGAPSGDVLAPAPISSGRSWKQVAAGRAFACAIDSADDLLCWGENYAGELGDGTELPHASPMPVMTPLKWRTVATGDELTCAISLDGDLLCWGDNRAGQAGAGTTDSSFDVPTIVDSADRDWTQVAVGQLHACAVRASGAMACWGDPAPSSLPMASTSPVEVVSDGILAVTVSPTHTCRLATNGLACAGAGSVGQLGDGVHGPVAGPVQVMDLGWDQVEAGEGTTCARAGTAVYCWGDNTHGQLGNGLRTRSLTPTLVAGTWVEVSSGKDRSCARDGANRVACWGAGGVFSSSTPAPIGAATYDSVSAGDHVCARNATAWCLGRNDHGQVGDGTTIGRTMPVDTGMMFATVEVGRKHTCGLDSNDKIYCWGDNTDGQLGLGATTPASVAVPTASVDTGSYGELYVGPYTSCVIDAARSARCWGANPYGGLGDGSSIDRPNPTPIVGTWGEIAIGYFHTCAISRSDKSLWCWGHNQYGQLGDLSLPRQEAPRQLSTAGWRSIGSGDDHSCGIKDDRTLWCWGSNNDGELGTGDGWSPEFVAVELPDA